MNAAEEAPTAAVAVARNDFGLRLLRALNANGTATNLIVSPLSVSQALTMTYNGARGSTKTAMGRTLGIGAMSGSQLNASNRQLLEALRKADPNARLEIANALWLREGLAINPEFVALNKDYYGADVRNLDFAGDPERATENHQRVGQPEYAGQDSINRGRPRTRHGARAYRRGLFQERLERSMSTRRRASPVRFLDRTENRRRRR